MSRYQFAGTVKAPEEKKNKLNEMILQVLGALGIRKTEEIMLGEKRITVTTLPKPDEKGCVYFNYSILEKKEHEPSCYDMKTCEFREADPAYADWTYVVPGIVVRMMLEAYSEETCYLMEGDVLCPVSLSADVVERITGEQLQFKNRERLWDIVTFLKKSHFIA